MNNYFRKIFVFSKKILQLFVIDNEYLIIPLPFWIEV